MHRGLTMPEDEKARRHEQLYKTVTTHTLHTWATMLAKKLLERLGSSNMAHRTPFIPKYELERHYAELRAERRRLEEQAAEKGLQALFKVRLTPLHPPASASSLMGMCASAACRARSWRSSPCFARHATVYSKTRLSPVRRRNFVLSLSSTLERHT